MQTLIAEASSRNVLHLFLGNAPLLIISVPHSKPHAWSAVLNTGSVIKSTPLKITRYMSYLLDQQYIFRWGHV